MGGFSKKDGEQLFALGAALGLFFLFAKIHTWWTNRPHTAASGSGPRGTVEVIDPTTGQVLARSGPGDDLAGVAADFLGGGDAPGGVTGGAGQYITETTTSAPVTSLYVQSHPGYIGEPT